MVSWPCLEFMSVNSQPATAAQVCMLRLEAVLDLINARLQRRSRHAILYTRCFPLVVSVVVKTTALPFPRDIGQLGKDDRR